MDFSINDSYSETDDLNSEIETQLYSLLHHNYDSEMNYNGYFNNSLETYNTPYQKSYSNVPSTSFSNLTHSNRDKNKKNLNLNNLRDNSSCSKKLPGHGALNPCTSRRYFGSKTTSTSTQIQNDDYLCKILENLPNSYWQISNQDIHVNSNKIQFPKCTNCLKKGHKETECPLSYVRRICFLCGSTGHSERMHIFCHICLDLDHMSHKCPYRNKVYKFCHNCDQKSHWREICPSIWRQYHLTTQNENKTQTNAKYSNHRKSKKSFTIVNYDEQGLDDLDEMICCYNCGYMGHKGKECVKYRMTKFVPHDTAIINYNQCPIPAHRNLASQLHSDARKVLEAYPSYPTTPVRPLFKTPNGSIKNLNHSIESNGKRKSAEIKKLYHHPEQKRVRQESSTSKVMLPKSPASILMNASPSIPIDRKLCSPKRNAFTKTEKPIETTPLDKAKCDVSSKLASINKAGTTNKTIQNPTNVSCNEISDSFDETGDSLIGADNETSGFSDDKSGNIFLNEESDDSSVIDEDDNSFDETSASFDELEDSFCKAGDSSPALSTDDKIIPVTKALNFDAIADLNRIARKRCLLTEYLNKRDRKSRLAWEGQ
ncbi:unnamed protein product [Gordionus sp. m RMFG-2023]|uniref:uncharacterized protein LOC135923851 n=1 Tax=Gordionus sp. m RMFG-2023 TaxID=3053472 RepID=UPI0030E59755